MGSVSQRKIRILITIAICLAIIAITIAYAIKKQKELNRSWDIHFEELSASVVGLAQYTMPVFSSTVLTNYTVDIKKPGDSATFQFKVVNNGNRSAKLSSIVKSIPRCEGNNEQEAKKICDQLVYTIMRDDGTELSEGESLNPQSSMVVKVLVEYPKTAKKVTNEKVRISNLDVDLLYREK